ncbi:hypothetical protein [Clostridium sp. D53t1_180928_C8]|uniref:hypothetical protein n=1 Tax=Clostridium sp. D53t1_180928_C8 TaxID=2787101 RepID=UPI0018AB7DB0|nr:hypothetical protein [Clostridium sp. D53t1_180928_C8]
MRINKKYSIESDVLNVTVYEHSVVKEKESKNFGKEVKKAVGYLTTIDQAFKFLIDREVKGTGMEDFNTIMNKIAELRFDIERMLKNE